MRQPCKNNNVLLIVLWCIMLREFPLSPGSLVAQLRLHWGDGGLNYNVYS